MARIWNSKKGFSLSEIPQIAILLVVLAVVLGVSATILTQTRANQCSGTYSGVTYSYENSTCYRVLDAENKTSGGSIAWNSTSGGLTGINTLASWQNTFAVIIAASVVVGIIGAYLMFGRK